MTVRLCLSGGPQPLLFNLDGAPPMPISDLRDVRLYLRETFYSLVKFKERANVVFFVRHARRFLTDRIGRDLAGIVKGDVLPARIDVIPATTIRPKVIRGDEDGLRDGGLAPQVRPIWRCGCTQREMQG